MQGLTQMIECGDSSLMSSSSESLSVDVDD